MNLDSKASKPSTAALCIARWGILRDAKTYLNCAICERNEQISANFFAEHQQNCFGLDDNLGQAHNKERGAYKKSWTATTHLLQVGEEPLDHLPRHVGALLVEQRPVEEAFQNLQLPHVTLLRVKELWKLR